MRCLFILLNINLVKLTLLKTSVTRKAVDQLSHKVLMMQEQMMCDAIKRGHEIGSNYEPLPGVPRAEIMKEVSGPVADERQNRLYDVLHKTDNYFAEGKDDVERAVNRYLKEEYVNIGENKIWTSTTNNYIVLVSYLSELHPFEDNKPGQEEEEEEDE